MSDLMDMGFAGAYYGMQDKLRKDALARDESQLRQAAGAMSLADMLRKAGQAQVEQQRAEQFRSAVAGLGPNPTQEQLATVGSQFASPKDLLDTHQKSLDRQTATAATERMRAATLQQQAESQVRRLEQESRFNDLTHEFRMSRVQSDAERLAETQRHNQASEQLAQQQNALNAQLKQLGLNIQQQGKVPAGYRATPEGNLQAIPGGPADTKLQGVMNQDTAALEGSIAALNRLGEQVNLVKNSKLSGITGIQGAIPNIPGSAAADAQANLDSLKSQVGFSVMQALKDASKTGSSGLGQITEREHIYLQQQLGSLDKAQSEKQIRDVLDNIAKFTDEAKGRIRNAYNMKHKDAATPQDMQSAPAPAASGGWSIRPRTP